MPLLHLDVRAGKKDPKARDAATVAAATACVAGGADIIRAHNVDAVRDGVRIADAIWRQQQSISSNG